MEGYLHCGEGGWADPGKGSEGVELGENLILGEIWVRIVVAAVGEEVMGRAGMC